MDTQKPQAYTPYSSKKYYLHIDLPRKQSNDKTDRDNRPQPRQPVVTIRQGSKTLKADNVVFCDANGNPVGKIVYSPDKPLRCGAKVWIEVPTDGTVLRFDVGDVEEGRGSAEEGEGPADLPQLVLDFGKNEIPLEKCLANK